jgi:hypothetical protein
MMQYKTIELTLNLNPLWDIKHIQLTCLEPEVNVITFQMSFFSPGGSHDVHMEITNLFPPT